MLSRWSITKSNEKYLDTSLSWWNPSNIFSELIQRGSMLKITINCRISALCKITPYRWKFPAPYDCEQSVCVAVSKPMRRATPVILQKDNASPTAARGVSPYCPTNSNVIKGIMYSEKSLNTNGHASLTIDLASDLKSLGLIFAHVADDMQHFAISDTVWFLTLQDIKSLGPYLHSYQIALSLTW